MLPTLTSEQNLRLHFVTMFLSQDIYMIDAIDRADELVEYVMDGIDLPDIEEPESVSITICLPYSPALLED